VLALVIHLARHAPGGANPAQGNLTSMPQTGA